MNKILYDEFFINHWKKCVKVMNNMVFDISKDIIYISLFGEMHIYSKFIRIV